MMIAQCSCFLLAYKHIRNKKQRKLRNIRPYQLRNTALSPNLQIRW